MIARTYCCRALLHSQIARLDLKLKGLTMDCRRLARARGEVETVRRQVEAIDNESHQEA
jgi:hypothetical protein